MVPTVNRNLQANDPVLPFAPDVPLPASEFVSEAMQLVNAVLANLGTPDDGLGEHWCGGVQTVFCRAALRRAHPPRLARASPRGGCVVVLDSLTSFTNT